MFFFVQNYIVSRIFKLFQPAESSLTGLFYTMDTNEDKKLTQGRDSLRRNS